MLKQQLIILYLFTFLLMASQNEDSKEANERKEKLKEYVENIASTIKKTKRLTKLEQATNAKPKQYFKTYEQIKKTLEEVKIFPKTDSEIMKGLFDRYNETRIDNEEEILMIIEDLEFLVHQYDNALEFIRLNGLNDIIYKNFNSTNLKVRNKSLVLLGALCQNNIKAQIQAMETGSLNHLQRILDEKYANQNALYALGAILRQFPWAQKKFLHSGGFVTLLNLFERENILIRLKTAILLNDLIMECESTENDEKMRQCKDIDLKKKLLKSDYCNKIEILFHDVLKVDQNDLDTIDKCIEVIEGVLNDCLDSYSNKLVSYLTNYKETFKESVNNEVRNAKDEL